MKHQDRHSFIADDRATQMGTDMATQFMLMTLFQIVSGMADDLQCFCSNVHKELADLVATYKLRAMTEDTERKIRGSAAKILDGILLRSFDQIAPRKVS